MQAVRKFQQGLSLVEMVTVIVIIGILGGMIATIIRGPVESYVESAQRADMSDIADTAFHRLVHDLRLALPNSVRVINGAGGATCNGSTDVCYLEYLEMIAGGRYTTTTTSCFDTASMVSPGVSCLTTIGDLVAGAASSVSNVLVNGRGSIGASAVVAINNPGNSCPSSSVYCGYGATITSVTNSGVQAADDVIYFSATKFNPSSANRFQIVDTPVTYACNPATGELTRYWNYAIQSTQPNTAGSFSTASSAVLATNISNCSFSYQSVTDASGQSAVLVTMPMIISKQNAEYQTDTLTLYGTAYAGSESAVYGGGNGSVP